MTSSVHSALHLLWVTVPERPFATYLARLLITEQLAGCVNILPGMQACYRWQGQLCEDEQLVLVVKTASPEACQARIVDEHPDDLPCVLQLPISGGHPPFLQWLAQHAAD